MASHCGCLRVGSAAGTAVRFALPITYNYPQLANQGFVANSLTFQAFASNTNNIYVGNAATMLRVTPFTDCVYVIKPGGTQNLPFFSPGASNIIAIDPWGIDWDTTGDGCLVSIFLK